MLWPGGWAGLGQRARTMEFSRNRRPSVRLGIAPLVDVVLLLLVFFLLTSSYVVPHALDLELPGSDTALASPEPSIVVGLDRTGGLSLNGQALSRQALGPALGRLLGSGSDRRVQVSADAGLSIETLVALLDDLRGAGARELALETRRER